MNTSKFSTAEKAKFDTLSNSDKQMLNRYAARMVRTGGIGVQTTEDVIVSLLNSDDIKTALSQQAAYESWTPAQRFACDEAMRVRFNKNGERIR